MAISLSIRHITSGGTEGNLFSLWLGKNFLLNKKISLQDMCVIKTSLTHYSVMKCADICSLHVSNTDINEQTWGMDPDGLSTLISKLYQKGVRGFLLPLTLGYTQTGTSDDMKAISHVIELFKNKHSDAHFFLWIDAALNGFILPFIDDSYKPFRNPLIQTLVVDFHKFIGVPYPASIVLYRNGLKKHTERTIPYLPESDSTISGSRPGASAASIWATLTSLGTTGIRSIIATQMKNKNYFIQELSKRFPTIQIINDPLSLTVGLIIPRKEYQTHFRRIALLYGLYSKPQKIFFSQGKHNTVNIYKIYFLPHVNLKKIHQFFHEVH